jgi:hypothetical protein
MRRPTCIHTLLTSSEMKNVLHKCVEKNKMHISRFIMIYENHEL